MVANIKSREGIGLERETDRYIGKIHTSYFAMLLRIKKSRHKTNFRSLVAMVTKKDFFLKYIVLFPLGIVCVDLNYLKIKSV